MVSAVSSSPPAYIPIDPGDPPPELDNTDTTSLTSSDLTSYLGNALSGLDSQISTLMDQAQSGDDPASMIQLQSLVSDRQALVTLATNLVASLAEGTQSEVQNIGRQ
jgi:hypothetical protein